MNKTIFLLLLIVVILALVQQYKKNRAEPFQSKSKEKSQEKSNIKSQLYRIFSRSQNKSLQVKENKLVLNNTHMKDLWVYLSDGNIYSLFDGYYLKFNTKNKALGISRQPNALFSWQITKKGQLFWFSNADKKKYCVPFNTMESIDPQDKKCLEYAWYLEKIPSPVYQLKNGQEIIYQELMEFPEKTVKNWKKNVATHKKYEMIDIYIFGYKPSFVLENKSNSQAIDITIDVKSRTAIFVVVLAKVSDNLQNLCTKFEKQKSDSAKPKTTGASNPKQQTPKSKKSVQCEKPSRNYNIEYHIQYPKLVQNVSASSAIEFGVQDPKNKKIYRCRDILTSPYYIKRFQDYL